MKRFATLRNARLLQLLGLVIAVVGLAGFWLTRDVQKAELTTGQRDLLGVDADDFHASFVVAGRDIFYEQGKTRPIYGEGGAIVCWEYYGAKNVYGTNTDTILYLNVINDDITMIMLPRDIFVEDQRWKLNSVYAREGADGLRRQVSSMLGVPVDYYAIINLGIFQQLVDDLGGVEVEVPTRMYHRDCAAGYTIDLQPGLQVLDGDGAAQFVRYRDLLRGDIDRLDNVKRLAYALLGRLQDLNVRAVTRLPELADTVFENVETNASPALVRKLLPRVNRLAIAEMATLPTTEVGTVGLEPDGEGLEDFLAATFGGRARTFVEAPDATLLITNRSGEAGLEGWYRDRLVGFGVPEERILMREGSLDSAPTRLVATSQHWRDADYYADLLHASKQQVDRLPIVRAQPVGLELVLGDDAVDRTPALAARASRR